MLTDLLRELATPAPRSLTDIAASLGTTPERVGIALEQCERLGYLDRGDDARVDDQVVGAGPVRRLDLRERGQVRRSMRPAVNTIVPPWTAAAMSAPEPRAPRSACAEACAAEAIVSTSLRSMVPSPVAPIASAVATTVTAALEPRPSLVRPRRSPRKARSTSNLSATAAGGIHAV